MPILSLIIFSPIVCALMIGLLPAQPLQIPRRAAFVFSLIPLALSLVMLDMFQPGIGEFQLTEKVRWIPQLGVYYSLGVDGFSVWLVLLTALLTPSIILASWGDIEKYCKEFMMLILALEGLMLGALLAVDLFLFFLFWELMLFPMFFIIGVWGGPRRRYATLKFVLFTMAGSAMMLAGMIYLVLRHAGPGKNLTFDIVTLYSVQLTEIEQLLLFAAFTVAFMIKVPMVPLHTWLADAHTEAPTGGSVDLAGVLLKMGCYAFLRFSLPMFPHAAEQAFPVIMTLAVIGIIYGAMVALLQPDMKRLVAYSSVSHMGFVMLGLYAFNNIGLTGGVLQMINHGLSTGALFILVGYIYHRRHTRMIEEYGGLWSVMPVYAALFLVVTLSSIGLPGTNGFVGEFLILLGAFRAHPVAGILGTLGVVLGAAYMLTLYKHVFFGPITKAVNKTLQDLSAREVLALAPILVLIFWIGLAPKPFLDRIEPSSKLLLDRIAKAGATRWLAETPQPPPVVAVRE
ncbi:MAG: NuoM family protein [Candidatus Binatia bacterium]